MSWEEFKNQAKQDLESCNFLCDEKNDMGNSAYLLQQSLEKYVKAYILKYELFVNEPYEFKHLPAEKMWRLLRNEIERKKKSYKKEIQDLLETLSPLLDQITEYFSKIRDHKDSTWRYSIWKQSLNIELNKSELARFENFTEEMKNKTKSLLDQSTTLLSIGKNRTRKYHDSIQKKSLEQLIDDTANIIFQIDLDTTDWIVNVSNWFMNLEKIIKIMLQATDSKDKLNVLQQPYMKVLLLAWLFSFRTEMILVFPHEEIGRYPETRGINSRMIYQNNKNNLRILIDKISICCRNIDDMMNL